MPSINTAHGWNITQSRKHHPMPIACKETSPPSSISHMKKIDLRGGWAKYLINYLNKEIKSFLEELVPPLLIYLINVCGWWSLSKAQAQVICHSLNLQSAPEQDQGQTLFLCFVLLIFSQYLQRFTHWMVVKFLSWTDQPLFSTFRPCCEVTARIWHEEQ